MFLNPALSSALDRIAERATDVRRAFIPGSTPQNDDVATDRPASEPTLDPLSVAAPSDAYSLRWTPRARSRTRATDRFTWPMGSSWVRMVVQFSDFGQSKENSESLRSIQSMPPLTERLTCASKQMAPFDTTG